MSESAGALGAPRVHFRRTGSTNEQARKLAAGGAPHGTLVTAGEQTAGRGRHGREWWSPPGRSLLMSLVLREASPLLPLAGAVAVCDVVGEDAGIKWPNDIVLWQAAGRLGKLAGILLEARPQEDWVILGIGVNVAVAAHDAPAAMRNRVASLEEPPDAIEPLLHRLLEALDRRLGETPQRTLDAWRARDALRGRTVNWSEPPRTAGDHRAGEEGRAEGIDGAGRLIVRRADGTRATLEAGEVHLSAPPDATRRDISAADRRPPGR
jgi:BirA family transcriptional regulator, biotin operon repressor / biotin---[acetyl-CoA-carboxylase] ligase